MFKLKNAKDWKTSVMAILGAVLFIVGTFYPDKLDPETQTGIVDNVGVILQAVGALIPILVGVFGAKDGNKEELKE